MSFASVLGGVLAVAAVPWLAAALYLAVLALFARRHISTGANAADLSDGTELPSFVVVIPAHNEGAGIAKTVASVAAVDYPAERMRVLVIADNCDDDTAAVARDAGATVLERADQTRRGKGYALSFAFDAILADEKSADAVVVIDADTSVAPNLLQELSRAVRAGHEVMQVHYGVRDADQSWRTRLTSLAFTLFHDVRSSARERLLLSCGLRGNGMCFQRDALRRVPHTSSSLVEDVEHGLQLGLAGVRIHYVQSTAVSGDMPSDSAASRSQRQRWEGGRALLRQQYAMVLLRAGMRQRSLMLLDLWADLLVPPLSALCAVLVLGTAASAVLLATTGSGLLALSMWGSAIFAVLLYITRGCAMTGHFVRALGDLLWAPVYIVWKLGLRAVSTARRGEWVRTGRTALPGTDV
jgi:1,2-diacylglycerol 3-beta-glucosyltransferase